MQLIKFLQAQGIGSKKQCQTMILRGLISLNAQICTEALTKIHPEEIHTLLVQAKRMTLVPLPYFYLLLHKPANFETSHQPKHHPSILSLLPENIRCLKPQAVGRLDEDTTGLLLLTNDGQFNHRMTSPKHAINKTYQITLKHPTNQSLCSQLLSGVVLNDHPEPVFALAAKLTDAHTLQLTIKEGRYHQVKRMIAAAGNRVKQLHRIQFGTFSLQDTKIGEWRWVFPEQ